MTIQIQELGGSPQETYSLDSFTATRTFILPWNQRDDFAKYFLGDRLYSCASLTDSGENTPLGSAIFGEVQDPSTNSRMQYPGKTGVYVVKIEFEPLDAESLDVTQITTPAQTLGDYKSFVKATVTYSSETTSADRRFGNAINL